MPVLKLFPCEGNGGSPLVDGAGNIVGIGKFKASKALGKCCHWSPRFARLPESQQWSGWPGSSIFFIKGSCWRTVFDCHFCQCRAGIAWHNL